MNEIKMIAIGREVCGVPFEEEYATAEQMSK
jgi:hypothetical protein